MHFKDALWDGSDPMYAPGRVKIRNGYKWQCPKKYKQAGYNISYVALSDDPIEQAIKCRELTREVIKWFENKDKSQVVKSKWKYLISRYRCDTHSPIHEKSISTQKGYLWWAHYWENAIGKVNLRDTNYKKIKLWEANMKSKGRNIAFINAAFRHLRIFVNYCKANEIEQAIRISSILSEMRFKTPKRREVHMTRKEAYKIIGVAMHNNHTSKALGYMIQYELGLSATDVIGDYIGDQWGNGLTWNTVSRDLSTITKGRNKTGTREIPYDISGIKPLQRLLKSVPKEKRVGPLIVSEISGRPYRSMSWTKGFKKMMTLAKLEGFQCRDLRASGITEGEQLGATREQLQKFAQHMSPNTTDIYMRGDTKLANSVIELRQERKKNL